MEQYRENGWLVVEGLVAAETLAEARRAIGELVEKAAGVTEHTDVYDLEPGRRADMPRVRRIKTPHKNHPLFWDIARAPALIAVLQQLLGPSGVRLHGSKLNMKSPHYGSPVEWHQDWAFYPHTNDDVLAVGVMLDECTVENGAMMVLSGSHKGPVFDHHCGTYFCGAMDPTALGLDFSQAVPLTGPAGAVSIHHARTIHGSAQNTSDRGRQLLPYEYAAADAWPLGGVKDYEAFNALLVAGEPTITPRLRDVPVRMPLPPSPRQGSIYENQTTAKHRYFRSQEPAAV
ncbi:MAG: phytanoyl-CoA dioxygenase family protein [Acetobacteraceae bacterium]|nr:phytanoyl-CoA dioxygenase family protein [Acetobacteraceae bacterium]